MPQLSQEPPQRTTIHDIQQWEQMQAFHLSSHLWPALVRPNPAGKEGHSPLVWTTLYPPLDTARLQTYAWDGHLDNFMPWTASTSDCSTRPPLISHAQWNLQKGSNSQQPQSTETESKGPYPLQQSLATPPPAPSSSASVKWINPDKNILLGSALTSSLPTCPNENNHAKCYQEHKLRSGSYPDLLALYLAIVQYGVHQTAHPLTGDLVLESTTTPTTLCEVLEIMLSLDNDHYSASMGHSLGSYHPPECGKVVFRAWPAHHPVDCSFLSNSSTQNPLSVNGPRPLCPMTVLLAKLSNTFTQMFKWQIVRPIKF